MQEPATCNSLEVSPGIILNVGAWNQGKNAAFQRGSYIMNLYSPSRLNEISLHKILHAIKDVSGRITFLCLNIDQSW
jgi:hypothetical protein